MSAWDGHANFTAYDEVESFDNYATRAELVGYRAERLARCAPYVELVRADGVPEGGLRVLEVGAGSSAFLYALELAGLLREGVAVELSASRHAFAERWRLDEGFRRVTNVQEDLGAFEAPAESFDRVVVLDDTYLYLRPEDEAYPGRLLELARAALRPGGALVLDFRNDAPLVRDLPTEGRTFRVDLPPTNAFVSAEYRQLPSPDRRLLRNESTYLARDGSTRSKAEVSEVVDPRELADTLAVAGFADVDLFGDLDRQPFDPARSPRVVVVARR